MQDKDIEAIAAAIAALQGQRGTLGDEVLEMALAPLRARLAALQRPAGLKHRQVSVLFVDIVGSTALAQSLLAEETLDMLSGTLQRMADIVQARGGRVLRFTGDGVKAAFGMDEAREDDAERAVRAGLAMLAAGREQAGEMLRLHGLADFSVRVGVHTGDVALGAGLEADNTAMGAAVNIAARMEQSAPPGALRISHDTWNHVRGLFEVEPQPPLPVKGVAAPMLTYLVRAARDRTVASVERGLQGLVTPMVGRQAELQRLLDTVARAGQTRQLQALTLLGDAGLGKSRLLRELRAALPLARPCAETGAMAAAAGTSAPGHRLLAVRSQPDGMLRPWGLLRNLVAAQCGVADTDSADAARHKVVQGLAPCFDARGEQQAQLLGQLCGLDFGDSPHVRGLDPRSLRDQAFAALRAYLQALAAQGGGLPLLLLVEDLHWADDGSLDLLQHLQAHAAELPLALLMTSRPALLQRRPDWATPATQLALSPLAPAHSDALAQALLQGLDVVPPALAELIVGQAEGNPYYMEELVRRLIDDGVIAVDGVAGPDGAPGRPRWTLHAERLDTVRLPGTLVGLLQARLDALPAGERLAARQASVIGHVFWDDALQALDANAPRALPALQQADFVRPHDASDFEGTVQRQFHHHLLHQVTYDTLLKAERRLGHGAAARWLAGRTRGRGAEFLAMTGEHAERAGETALAIDCFEQAAREAQKRFANAAASAYFRRTLAVLGESDPPRRYAVLIELEKIGDIVGDRSAQDAAQAELTALLERHPDERRQAQLTWMKALLADRRSDRAASERYARQAFELAERSQAARWAATSQGQLAWLRIAQQDYSPAVRHIQIGLQWAGKISEELQRAETEAQLLTLSGMVSMLNCRLAEARATLEAVLARGQALARPRLQLGALDNLGLVASWLGRWDEAIAWGEQARALSEAIGARSSLASALQRLARAAEASGDTATAMHGYLQSLAIERDIGNRRMQAVLLRMLGALLLDLGDAPAAWPHLAESRALHQGLDETIEVCELEALVARCEIQLGRREAAQSTVDALLARLHGELASRPAHELIDMRWTCQQVLQALADARAAPLLEALHTDMQARAAELSTAADRERLIQAVPAYRAIAAALQQLQRQPPPLRSGPSGGP